MLQKTFTEYELQKMAVKLKAPLKDKTYVLNSIDFEAAFQCIAHKGYLTNDETNKISAIITIVTSQVMKKYAVLLPWQRLTT